MIDTQVDDGYDTLSAEQCAKTTLEAQINHQGSKPEFGNPLNRLTRNIKAAQT